MAHRLATLLLFALTLTTGGPVLAAEPSRADLDAAVTRFWAALGNEPGGASDVTALRALFHPAARVLGVDPKRPGAPLRETALAEFLKAFEAPSERGFYELETKREVVHYGAMAHVLSIVESRYVRDAPRPEYVGINSVQWYWTGSAWQIVTLYYHLEDPRQPLPRAPAPGR